MSADIRTLEVARAARTPAPAGPVASAGAAAISTYEEITRLVERLHRRYLDVIRTELSRLGVDDLNAVQALLLVNVGRNEVAIKDLVERGYYVGSNITYNVRNLSETGYIVQNRSERDRRSVRIALTPRGLAIYDHLLAMEQRHAAALDGRLGDAEGTAARGLLRTLERIWSDSINYGPPPAGEGG